MLDPLVLLHLEITRSVSLSLARIGLDAIGALASRTPVVREPIALAAPARADSRRRGSLTLGTAELERNGAGIRARHEIVRVEKDGRVDRRGRGQLVLHEEAGAAERKDGHLVGRCQSGHSTGKESGSAG